MLELGPGSDLGIGVLLLSKGAARYNGCDVHALPRNAPGAFYQALFRTLKAIDADADIQRLAGSLHSLVSGAGDELNYVVRDDFDLVAAFGRRTIDVVFSQAAFEHFDDPEATIAGLSEICRPGAVIVAEIDLQAHSRGIRNQGSKQYLSVAGPALQPVQISRQSQPGAAVSRSRTLPAAWMDECPHHPTDDS